MILNKNYTVNEIRCSSMNENLLYAAQNLGPPREGGAGRGQLAPVINLQEDSNLRNSLILSKIPSKSGRVSHYIALPNNEKL